MYGSMKGHRKICDFPHWEKQGIRIIGDLVDSAGVVLSREQLGLEQLEYYRVKKMVGTLIKKHS